MSGIEDDELASGGWCFTAGEAEAELDLSAFGEDHKFSILVEREDDLGRKCAPFDHVLLTGLHREMVNIGYMSPDDRCAEIEMAASVGNVLTVLRSRAYSIEVPPALEEASMPCGNTHNVEVTQDGDGNLKFLDLESADEFYVPEHVLAEVLRRRGHCVRVPETRDSLQDASRATAGGGQRAWPWENSVWDSPSSATPASSETARPKQVHAADGGSDSECQTTDAGLCFQIQSMLEQYDYYYYLQPDAAKWIDQHVASCAKCKAARTRINERRS